MEKGWKGHLGRQIFKTPVRLRFCGSLRALVWLETAGAPRCSRVSEEGTQRKEPQQVNRTKDTPQQLYVEGTT